MQPTFGCKKSWIGMNFTKQFIDFQTLHFAWNQRQPSVVLHLFSVEITLLDSKNLY